MNKAYRLQKNRAFQHVYRRGKSVSCRQAVLIYVRLTRGQQRQELKIGFSISKKVGNAVTRNRVKRLMRENIRLQLPVIARGYHLVFVARTPCATAGYQEIGRAVTDMMRRAGLLSG